MRPVAAKERKLNPDGYVHARDVNEYQRLRDQALMWQRATEEMLDRIGLRPGMSCLDVGSGPGVGGRSRHAPPWPSSIACSRACSGPTAAISGQDDNCPRSSRRRVSDFPTAL